MREITVEVDGEAYELEALEQMTCEKCGSTWHLGFDRQQQRCTECGYSPSKINPTQVIIEPPSRAMDDVADKEELAQQFEDRADYLKQTAKAIRALDEEWTYRGANLLDAGVLVKAPDEEVAING